MKQRAPQDLATSRPFNYQTAHPLLLTHLSVVVLAMAAASCAREIVQFKVQYASGFVQGRKTISVFGVYKDGRMSTPYWDVLAPHFSTTLGSDRCDVFFGKRLSAEDPKLFSKIDDVAKEEGITTELLTQVAPRAKGDLIMVVNVFGKPPAKRDVSTQPAQQAPPRMGGMGPSRRGRGGSGRRQSRREPGQVSAFQMIADLISASAHDIVATVQMRYAGSSLREAIAKFTEKLRGAIPDSGCGGWKWKD